MENENESLPLDGLKKMEERSPTTTPTTTPSPAQTPSKFSKKPVLVDTSKAARRLTWIILIETVLLLALAGLDVYLAFVKIPSLTKANESLNEKIKAANSNVSQLNEDKGKLESDIIKLRKDKINLEGLSASQTTKIKSLEEEMSSISKAKQELEQKAAQLGDDKTKLEGDIANLQKDYNKLEQDSKDAVDQRNELEKTKGKIETDLADLKKEYDVLKEQIDSQKKAVLVRQQEWETEYVKYTAGALKIVDELNKIASSLKEGVNIKSLSQVIKESEVPFEEFKPTLNADLTNCQSFKLISLAYNNYNETLERLKSIKKTNPHTPDEDEIKWSDKILKLENPLSTNRPWMDHVQELWNDAVYATQIAGLLIGNKEAYPEKCPVCGGKEQITCIKCNGNAYCPDCEGKGFFRYNKETVCCNACEASGKCPVCLGKTTIPCKFSLMNKNYPPMPKTSSDIPKTPEPIKDTPPTEQPK
ncbi:MAG: hypothetical protein V1871_03760 [Planctomycetota bacterium]